MTQVQQTKHLGKMCNNNSLKSKKKKKQFYFNTLQPVDAFKSVYNIYI